MKIKSRKLIAYLLVSCLLMGMVSMTGCSSNKNVNNPSTQTPSNTPVAETTAPTDVPQGSTNGQISLTELRKQYGETENFDYTDPIYNVSPKEYVHKIPLEFSAKDYSEEQLRELFNVYTDAKLENTAAPVIEYDEASNTVLLKPSQWGILPVVDDANFSEGDYSSWGYVSKLYFAVNVDTTTGEKLAKPKVTVVTFTNGLQSPTVSFHVTEDGRAGLSWAPVEGATKYLVCYTLYTDGFSRDANGAIVISQYGIDQVTASQCIFKLAETSDTKYEDIYDKETGDYVFSMNLLAATDADLQKGFCVIALNDEGHSLASNILKIKTFLPELPCFVNADEAGSYDDPSAVPLTTTVTMVDTKHQVQFPKEFDFDAAMDAASAEAASGSPYCSVSISYVVKGTQFSGSLTLTGSSEDIIGKIEALQKRYEEETLSGGSNSIDINLPDTPPSDVVPPSTTPAPTAAPTVAPTAAPTAVPTAVPTEIPDPSTQSTIDMPDIPICASNSLTAYLASQMLLGKTAINLNDFAEASNTEYLADCLYEAIYQNPLILNVHSFGLDYGNNDLLVDYQDMDATTMSNKQAEIKEEVSKVTSQIITDGMTDLEKEVAINKYLCDSAEYDDAACEHAMANNMQIVDPQYLDSFSPYGILIKKKGVCSSYAASFKLLADAAGLQAIVITGKLNGTIAHAWNRVKIEDQWYTVDSTNNDNELIPNALLNLSDQEAAPVLVEDVDFICDNQLSIYTATGTDYEYYRMNHMYFDSSDITGISGAIQADGTYKVFRTNYDITTDGANTVIKQALAQNNYSGAYRYQVFLGVIVLDLGN